MAIQKKVNGAWQPINPKQLKGIPYTGALPATLTGTKAGYLHKYKVYGNTEQIGTPTPENPIVPSGCGERTGNLFDKDATLDGYWLSSATGNAVSQAGYSVSDYIRASDGESYTLVEAGRTFCWYDENKRFISTTASTTASAPTGAAYFRVNLYTANKRIAMVIEGLTAPTEYIPYGYKLPILSNSTLTNIYLGEVQTTRRVKKLVLTGEEFWDINEAVSTNDTIYIYSSIIKYGTFVPEYAICSHFEHKDVWIIYDECGFNLVNYSSGLRFRIMRTIAGTVTDFKSYLAAQYAAGTPVTVWYALAEPEAGIVNEPLMKIGDYVDSITSSQAGAQIPTSAGETTISWAGEGLAPSEFDSIQEWVDIPTYTYTNGAWVADN